ncbi:MAG: hypothetical protein KH611_01825, partial [Clostridium sp.]|nr:hypothetical protein [Clostridium sp.]
PYTQDKFSCARKLNEAMPVASSIEADAADGNLALRLCIIKKTAAPTGMSCIAASVFFILLIFAYF